MPIAPARLPREPGTYLLLLTLPERKMIAVGGLGAVRLDRGWYAYAGSAFGPGGLAARLARHLGPVEKRHWHIDYLRAEAVAMEIWMAPGPPRREHRWALRLARGPHAGEPIPGFGCSDCRCPSHLIRFDCYPGEDLMKSKLGAGVVCLRLITSKGILC